MSQNFDDFRTEKHVHLGKSRVRILAERAKTAKVLAEKQASTSGQKNQI